MLEINRLQNLFFLTINKLLYSVVVLMLLLAVSCRSAYHAPPTGPQNLARPSGVAEPADLTAPGPNFNSGPDRNYQTTEAKSSDGGQEVKKLLLDKASGAVSQSLENYLSSYGQAKVSLKVDEKGGVTGSGDLLYPLYDSEKTTVFTQIGLRNMDNDRLIGNFGLGQRFFSGEKTAVGYNAFFDQDFTRQVSRASLGLELWHDWLRLGSNLYLPLSSWRDSEDFTNTQERAARGWDIKAKGYLPNYRQIAITGGYEEWSGDKVGLFGTTETEKNPKIWSYGLQYTPFPLLTASVNRQDSGQAHNTEVMIGFTWYFGKDMDYHLSGTEVQQARSVSGGRHDFVDRNNNIILEYKKKRHLHFSSEGITVASGSVKTGQSARLKAQVLDGDKPVRGLKVNWQCNQGHLVAESQPASTLAKSAYFLFNLFSATPAYADDGVFSYTDQNGYTYINLDQTNPAPVTITAMVDEISISKTFQSAAPGYLITPQPNTVNEDAPTDVKITITADGTPLPSGTKILLSAGPEAFDNLPAEIILGEGGQATLPSLIAEQIGSLIVTATLPDGSQIAFTIKAIPPGTPDNIYSLTITGANKAYLTEGSITETVILTKNGEPLADTDLVWSSDGGAAVSFSGGTKTDSSGRATVEVTITAAGTYTLSVAAQDAGHNQLATANKSVIGLTPEYRITLAAQPSATVSYGTSITVVATLTHADDNSPVPGKSINWQWKTVGSKVAAMNNAPSSTTDASGQATYTPDSSVQRRVLVSASLNASVKDEITLQYGDRLPNEYITGQTTFRGTWPEAKAYCSGMGGRLPGKTELEGVCGLNKPASWPTNLQCWNNITPAMNKKETVNLDNCAFNSNQSANYHQGFAVCLP